MRPLVNPPRHSQRSLYFGTSIALIIFAFGILVDSLQTRFNVSGWALWLDEAVAAATVGAVIFIYERRREKELLEKLKVIELMNHHVRNALQPVMGLPYSKDKEQEFKTIEDAVTRIDWALREILPGVGEEESSSNAA
jgi:low affinity Fe/Cu permease